jgi:allantoinase
MSLPPHRVDYSPIIDRLTITWPNNARVAFWVAPNVEHAVNRSASVTWTQLWEP